MRFPLTPPPGCPEDVTELDAMTAEGIAGRVRVLERDRECLFGVAHRGVVLAEIPVNTGTFEERGGAPVGVAGRDQPLVGGIQRSQQVPHRDTGHVPGA
jgi:hypothetical protein